MTYFEDGSAYSYAETGEAGPLVNIGWLSTGHPYLNIVDEVPQDVLDRLYEDSIVGGSLPSRTTAVTPSVRDLRVGDIISIPEG